MQQAWLAAPSDTTAAGIGARDSAVIQHAGDHWTLVYAGVTCHMRHTRGLRVLQYLLQRPGEAISALDLDLSTTEPGTDALPIGPLAAERARINVTRSLHNILERIRPAHRDLYLHLRATIKTGTTCSYTPDMSVPIRWSVAPDDRG